MSYPFIVAFIGGLLLAVRLMFFGAERKPNLAEDGQRLRRIEPGGVAFLLAFGLAGYAFAQHGVLPIRCAVYATFTALLSAAVGTWLAVLTSRIEPEFDPDDVRYVHQGRVGIVRSAIPADGEGMICCDGFASGRDIRARDISNGAIPFGEEVCIERVEDGVAYVELWSLVERRL